MKRKPLPIGYKIIFLNKDPKKQSEIIELFKQYDIPVHERTTEFDPKFPYLYWFEDTLTQISREKAVGTAIVERTVEGFLSHFFS